MPTAPGYADISIQLRHASVIRPAFLTFGVDPTSTDPTQVATSVFQAANYTGSLVSVIDNNVTVTGVRVSLGTDGAEDIVYQATYAQACGAAGTTLPPNVAALIHKNTGRGGRRGRGRMFIPWCLQTTAVSEAGIITGSAITTLSNAVQVFLTRLGVETVPMVVLHNPGSSAPGAPNTVLTLTVDSLVSTQRRRLGR